MFGTVVLASVVCIIAGAAIYALIFAADEILKTYPLGTADSPSDESDAFGAKSSPEGEGEAGNAAEGVVP